METAPQLGRLIVFLFWRINKMVVNTCCVVSNYATSELQRTLSEYAKRGYQLVSTEMAKNSYGVEVMYLFFTFKTKE